MAAHDLDAAIDAFREAQRSMPKGDSAPVMDLYSRRDDVTLANPLGPPITGRKSVEREAAAVASSFADGDVEFDEVVRYAGADVGYVVAIERIRARRVGSGETVEMALRVTTVFRLEEDGWRICLRHADRFTTPQRREDSGT